MDEGLREPLPRVELLSAGAPRGAARQRAAATSRGQLEGRLGSLPSARSTLYTCPNEGLSDAVVAHVEVRSDNYDRLAALIEHSGFTDLVVIERLATELDTLIAEQLQQATLREGVLHAEGRGRCAGLVLRDDLSDESWIEATAQESRRRL